MHIFSLSACVGDNGSDLQECNAKVGGNEHFSEDSVSTGLQL